MPALQKIYQDFQDKGLVMLGMDVGEDQDTVGKFLLGTKLNYPIVLAGETDVVQGYSVTAFPTAVLIDSEGKIAWYHVGSGGDKALRAVLAKLGLSTSPANNTQ
jgi:thioredoxin-related protein